MKKFNYYGYTSKTVKNAFRKSNSFSEIMKTLSKSSIVKSVIGLAGMALGFYVVGDALIEGGVVNAIDRTTDAYDAFNDHLIENGIIDKETLVSEIKKFNENHSK